MFKRYWIIAAVFGLIAGIALGQTNEQATHSNNETNAQHSQPQTLPVPVPVPVPVEIVESDSAAKARERQEKETNQREIKDLAAQEGMNAATQEINAATQDMRDYAFYSTILVGIGTVLLIFTLWLTIQANKAARAAVEVTERIGKAQVRAYIEIKTIYFAYIESENHIEFGCEIQNHGQSPANKAYADVVVNFHFDDRHLEFSFTHPIGVVPIGDFIPEPFGYPQDIKISLQDFKASHSCSATVTIWAEDVFEDGIEVTKFFVRGGPPGDDLAYIMSQSIGELGGVMDNIFSRTNTGTARDRPGKNES